MNSQHPSTATVDLNASFQKSNRIPPQMSPSNQLYRDFALNPMQTSFNWPKSLSLSLLLSSPLSTSFLLTNCILLFLSYSLLSTICCVGFTALVDVRTATLSLDISTSPSLPLFIMYSGTLLNFKALLCILCDLLRVSSFSLFCSFSINISGGTLGADGFLDRRYCRRSLFSFCIARTR